MRRLAFLGLLGMMLALATVSPTLAWSQSKVTLSTTIMCSSSATGPWSTCPSSIAAGTYIEDVATLVLSGVLPPGTYGTISFGLYDGSPSGSCGTSCKPPSSGLISGTSSSCPVTGGTVTGSSTKFTCYSNEIQLLSPAFSGSTTYTWYDSYSGYSKGNYNYPQTYICDETFTVTFPPLTTTILGSSSSSGPWSTCPSTITFGTYIKDEATLVLSGKVTSKETINFGLYDGKSSGNCGTQCTPPKGVSPTFTSSCSVYGTTTGSPPHQMTTFVCYSGVVQVLSPTFSGATQYTWYVSSGPYSVCDESFTTSTYPPPKLPEFPLGMALTLALALPGLLFIRSRYSPLSLRA